LSKSRTHGDYQKKSFILDLTKIPSNGRSRDNSSLTTEELDARSEKEYEKYRAKIIKWHEERLAEVEQLDIDNVLNIQESTLFERARAYYEKNRYLTPLLVKKLGS